VVENRCRSIKTMLVDPCEVSLEASLRSYPSLLIRRNMFADAILHQSHPLRPMRHSGQEFMLFGPPPTLGIPCAYIEWMQMLKHGKRAKY
jgi:hypothetical protein